MTTPSRTDLMLEGPTTQIVRCHLTRILDTAQFLGRVIKPICDDILELTKELEAQATMLAEQLQEEMDAHRVDAPPPPPPAPSDLGIPETKGGRG